VTQLAGNHGYQFYNKQRSAVTIFMHVAAHDYRATTGFVFTDSMKTVNYYNNFGNCLYSPYSEGIKYAARVNLSVVKNQSLKLWFRISF
jgi:hypothetical protein